MFKVTMKYKDYKGKSAEKVVMLNLTKLELATLDSTFGGDFRRYIGSKARTESENLTAVMKIVDVAYGELSEDGERFHKSEDILNAFKQSKVYEEFFVKYMLNVNEFPKVFSEMINLKGKDKDLFADLAKETLAKVEVDIKAEQEFDAELHPEDDTQE